MFDLVTRRPTCGAFGWRELAASAENQAMERLVSLTGMPAGAFGFLQAEVREANLSAMVTARGNIGDRDERNSKTRGIVIASNGAHSSIQRRWRRSSTPMSF
ncbi:MAG: hypothetical protein IPG67_17205 [Acidobacteria bacterium]|nr:hypothetical protein [Acidobacteriota bacterium]